MATVEIIPVETTVVGERLLTAADLDAFPERLPSGQVSYELHNGRLVIMNPPAADHSKLQSLICREIGRRADDLGHGTTYTELGLLLWRNPDQVVGPDVAFIRAGRPEIVTSEGFMETMPSLVVEIRSKNDSWPKLEAKAHDYLKAGVPVVWLVNPAKKAVVVFCPQAEPTAFVNGQQLTLPADIIPGFQLDVDLLFPNK